MLTRRTQDSETRDLTRGRKRVLMLLPAGIVLGALFVLAAPAPASAKNEFEDGFKRELGRIAAHQAVGLGRGVLGHVVHGGYDVVRADHRRGGRKHGHARGHQKRRRHDRYYQPYPEYRPWWSFRRHHRGHGYRHGYRPYKYGIGYYDPGHGHRGHRHGRACGHR